MQWSNLDGELQIVFTYILHCLSVYPLFLNVSQRVIVHLYFVLIHLNSSKVILVLEKLFCAFLGVEELITVEWSGWSSLVICFLRAPSVLINDSSVLKYLSLPTIRVDQFPWGIQSI